MSLYDEVYGLKYRSASEQMSLLVQSIQQKGYDGFESLGDLEKWAHDHLLDKLCLVICRTLSYACHIKVKQ